MSEIKILVRKATIINEEGDEQVITFSVLCITMSERSRIALNAGIVSGFRVRIEDYSVSDYSEESPGILYTDLPLFIKGRPGNLLLTTTL